jgi:hypothetical protein
MAAFFANIQVQSRDRLAVAEAVETLLAAAGYALEEETYGGDRSIYVGPATNGWVGVYDSACDGVSVGPLAWLAQGLSQHLNTVTLAWLVNDSALLLYLLFARGEVQDRYISHAAYFTPGAQAASDSGPLGGDGERLLDVAGVVGNGAAVTRWLQRPAPFAEETLRRVAATLGQAHADLGHADLEADLMDDTHLEEPSQFERLEFVQLEADAADAGR